MQPFKNGDPLKSKDITDLVKKSAANETLPQLAKKLPRLGSTLFITLPETQKEKHLSEGAPEIIKLIAEYPNNLTISLSSVVVLGLEQTLRDHIENPEVKYWLQVRQYLLSNFIFSVYSLTHNQLTLWLS